MWRIQMIFLLVASLSPVVQPVKKQWSCQQDFRTRYQTTLPPFGSSHKKKLETRGVTVPDKQSIFYGFHCWFDCNFIMGLTADFTEIYQISDDILKSKGSQVISWNPRDFRWISLEILIYYRLRFRLIIKNRSFFKQKTKYTYTCMHIYTDTCTCAYKYHYAHLYLVLEPTWLASLLLYK